MATIFQMPDRPFWFYQIVGADGKRLPRVSTKTTSKRLAKKMAEDAEAKERERARSGNSSGRVFARFVENAARLADEGKLSADRAEEMIRELRQIANPNFKETTLSVYWTGWNARRARLVSESTADNYGHAFKKWSAVAPEMMLLPLMEVEVKHIRDGVAAMQTGETAIAFTTAGNYVAALKDVLDSAIEDRLLTTNPARSREVRRGKRQTATKEKEKVGPFTLDEVRSLVAVSNEEWKGMILFGFHTGLRMMDIAFLGETNINSAQLLKTSAKTTTLTRTPLHPQLTSWIKGRTGDYFPKIRTMTNSNVSTTFSNLMKKAGVPRDTVLPGGEKVKRSFHSLRHTFTSILANAGIPVEIRMKLTGQKDSEVHAGYTHHDSKALVNAVKKLPTL